MPDFSWVVYQRLSYYPNNIPCCMRAEGDWETSCLVKGIPHIEILNIIYRKNGYLHLLSIY